jgi:hypothetical protein
MASSRPWSFEDDDRPSGSVRPLSQSDLQTILAHLTSDPNELLAGTDAEQPVVAVRVPASVSQPGGFAQATWRRLRAAEWTAWTRTLPWRVAAILTIGASGGILGSLLTPRLGRVLGVLAAAAAGWGLRFQPSLDAVAWQRGATGERRTARLLDPLERQGWAVLHDLALPGSRANIDHLVIGPGGVFVIDSKHYRGRLQFDPSGRLWHGRYPLAPRCGRCRSRPTRPPRSCLTRAWPWCRSWPSTAPRSHGARSSCRAYRWCRPGACQACFANSRRYWGPNGSPRLPVRPESASALPLDTRHAILGDGCSCGSARAVGETRTALDQRRPRRIAVLGRLRVERRANGDASSAMTRPCMAGQQAVKVTLWRSFVCRSSGSSVRLPAKLTAASVMPLPS